VNDRCAGTVLTHPNRLGEYPAGHDTVLTASAGSLSVVVLVHVGPLPR
jgi:hypothetical protein